MAVGTSSSLPTAQRKESLHEAHMEFGVPSPIQRDFGFLEMIPDSAADQIPSEIPSIETQDTTEALSANPPASGIVSNDEDITVQPSFLQLFYSASDLDLPTTSGLGDIDMHARLDTDVLELSTEDESEWQTPESVPAGPEESFLAARYSNLEYSLNPRPRLQIGSPEHIAFLFNQRICEVLCIRDGTAGNPWRRIVWPLAQDNVTLYHAIAAMTFFQDANKLPHFRSKGVQHLNTSIQQLYGTHGSDKVSLRLEVALAATLVLGFAQTWYYPRSSTGIQFVKSAKRLLKKALGSSRTSDMEPSTSQHGNMDYDCLGLLANTWIYMDVITRFTCRNTHRMDTRFIAACQRLDRRPHTALQVDPLMGAATTLFPLIGRVADLVNRVHASPAPSMAGYEELNPPGLVAEAVELKVAIECWTPFSLSDLNTPNMSDSMESMTSASASDLIQTANAYKWATILLLHQAVPEIPRSHSTKQLARRVLVLLATVPLGSRAIIFPVLPLLVSGCEATEKDDRDWVRSRWRALATGNSSGIVDRCLEITLEVWRRRDHEIQPWSRYAEPNTPAHWDEDLFHSRLSTEALTTPEIATLGEAPCVIQGSESVTPEYTVRSKQHWLSVMRDWGWEGKNPPACWFYKY